MRKVYLITPVLNEAANMPALINSWRSVSNELTEFEFEFILVDDGSTDGTATLAASFATGLSFRVLRHEKNMGPGYAFGTGFEWLATQLKEDDIIVTIEGDNTSRIETLKIMLGRIVRENVDVVFASPHAYGGGFVNTSWWRMMASHAASAMTKLLLNIHGILTFSSFFRAYQGRVILTLQKKYGPRILEFRGFECMVELLKKLVLLGVTISEVPMNLDTSLRKGKSKLKVFKTTRKYFEIFFVAHRWELKK
jgi:dolichol-phosphate mannosyltransferase